MLSKCANPECRAQLRYLHEGRIFRFDVEARLASGRRPAASAVKRASDGKKIGLSVKGRPTMEYFWLCENCISQMTLAVRDGEVAVIQTARARRAAS